jgi:hypothetical protein
MPIEIDQSNKVERTDKDTILALSNGKRRAIVISAKVKRDAIVWMKLQKKSDKTIYLHLFTAGLFILLHPYLADIIKHNERIIIDDEYTGQESKIRGMLLRHIHKAGFQLAKDNILFAQIGRASTAHVLAWQVQRKFTTADYAVRLDDLIGLLK